MFHLPERFLKCLLLISTFSLFILVKPTYADLELVLSDPPYLTNQPIQVTLSDVDVGRCYVFTLRNLDNEEFIPVGNHDCDAGFDEGTEAIQDPLTFSIPAGLIAGDYVLAAERYASGIVRKVNFTVEGGSGSDAVSLEVTPNPGVEKRDITMTASGCQAGSTFHFEWIKNDGDFGEQVTGVCDGEDRKTETDCAENVTVSPDGKASYTKSTFSEGEYELIGLCQSTNQSSKIPFSVTGLDEVLQKIECPVCPVGADWSRAHKSCCEDSTGKCEKPVPTTTQMCDTLSCEMGRGCAFFGYAAAKPPCKKGVIYKRDGNGKVTSEVEKEVVPEDASDVIYDEIDECIEVDTSIGTIGTSPNRITERLFGVLLGFSGGLAILLIIRAGYMMMSSQGNPEAIQQARERMTSAIVGLLFVVLSFVILQIIGVDILKVPGLS